MAASNPTAALAALLRKTNIDDHEEALKAANAVLKSSKTDPTAQHTRLIALLKLDRFDDALRAIAEGGSKLETTFALEYAYALYKNGQLEKSREVLGKSGTSDRAHMHVAAQVAYRAERFDEAADAYRALAVEDDGRYGEENDLKINLLAANAQLEWQGRGYCVPDQDKQPRREDLEAFETAYNVACGCIARGDIAKAAILLRRSKDLCEAAEDLSEEDKKMEILPIIVQQIYVLSRLGKLDEALNLQQSIQVSELFDASSKALAKNNTLAIKGSDNPYLTQRLFETVTPPTSGNDKLFEYQASMLRRNKHVVDLQAQKFNGVINGTTHVLSSSIPSVSQSIVKLGVLSAAAHSQLHTGKEALRQILPLLDKRPHDVGLLLTIIQLYVQTKNPGPALNLLDAFFKRLKTATTPDHEDVRFAPGLVALAVSLYRLQGRQNAIRTELAKAASHWEKKQPASGGYDMSLIREAGIELLKSGSPSDLAAAGAAFDSLMRQSGDSDKVAAAGLVASFATTEFAKAEPHLAALTPIDRLAAGADVAALIDGGVATLPAPAPAQQQPGRSNKRSADGEPTAGRPAPQKKRQRRRALPKGYDEGRTPDPERWLPLRDRSSYRPKGKKGKRRALEATQGGVVREETLQLAGGAGEVRVEKAAGGGSKKKKKGKK